MNKKYLFNSDEVIVWQVLHKSVKCPSSDESLVH